MVLHLHSLPGDRALLRRVVAVSLLALLLPATSSAAPTPTPTKLWYQLSVVYIGTHTEESIFPDGAKSSWTFKTAFVAKTNTAVLVRAAGNGSLRVSSGDLAGKVTRYSSEFFLDWFVGTHAPCKEHTIVTLAQPQPFVGTFGAEPDGPGRTGFGVVSGSLLRTRVEEPAIVPCAGSVRGRPITLINEAKVKLGEQPEYLVQEHNHSSSAGGDDIMAMRKIPSRERKYPQAHSAGKFGLATFSLFSHRVVRHPLTYSKHGLFRYGADEAWTLIFTRCPGTSPC